MKLKKGKKQPLVIEMQVVVISVEGDTYKKRTVNLLK
jgi:hypothetical protein